MDTATLTPLLVGVILGVVVGALAAWALLSRTVSAERIRTAQAEGALATLRADNEALRALQGGARSLEDLLQPVRDSLDTLRRASDQAGRERTAAEATITTQITAVQERYQSLETTTRQLAAALARGQTRGQWGEMQLEGILEHAGLVEGTHFVRQDSRAGDHGSTRPDLVVRLPGGGEILVDAKFPFDAYWLAISAEDPAQRDELMRKHAADVLLRVRELSGKRYSDSSVSPDFVVMFLPARVAPVRLAGGRRPPAGEGVRATRGAGHADHDAGAAPHGGIRVPAQADGRQRRGDQGGRARRCCLGWASWSSISTASGAASTRPCAGTTPSSARSTARPCARPDGWPISAWSPLGRSRHPAQLDVTLRASDPRVLRGQ